VRHQRTVIAREGGQSSNHRQVCVYWMPAFAGMTAEGVSKQKSPAFLPGFSLC
jgi:hypothetical protein